jgi:alpha-ketoglutarate-dependent taurine dioxygenase
MLISELMEHATQPQFVYTHTWAVGDLIIWDNRCTLHRGGLTTRAITAVTCGGPLSRISIRPRRT